MALASPPPAAVVLVPSALHALAGHNIAHADGISRGGNAAASQRVDSSTGVIVPWAGQTVRDLHQEYRNVFRKGNRNAASHLWSTFLLERSAGMEQSRLELMFSGFCAVSGSPVHPSKYTTYRMSLDTVSGGKAEGYTFYCCWPCVCDTQDFIRVDTKTIQTAEGPRQYHWMVIGNPCTSPDKVPYEAPEVTCVDGELVGATMSDNGYVILTMFPLESERPGLDALHEDDYAGECHRRMEAGYNSGMGEIFRHVAGISPLITRSTDGAICAVGECPASSRPAEHIGMV